MRDEIEFWNRWRGQYQSSGVLTQLSSSNMVSAANSQENDGAVKVLMRISETKNKNEKKNTENEIETKTSELFSDFQTFLLSGQEDVAVILSPDFTKKQKFREQNNEILEIGLFTF